MDKDTFEKVDTERVMLLAYMIGYLRGACKQPPSPLPAEDQLDLIREFAQECIAKHEAIQTRAAVLLAEL